MTDKPPAIIYVQTRGYFADEEKTAGAFKGLIKGEEDSGRVYLQVCAYVCGYIWG